MLHRGEKCSDILKVASVGGGESAHLNACHFSHSQFQLCHQRSLGHHQIGRLVPIGDGPYA